MMAEKTFHIQPVLISTIYLDTKFYTSSPSSWQVYATQLKVEFRFSHSCKVVLHYTKFALRKASCFSKNHYHKVLYSSTECCLCHTHLTSQYVCHFFTIDCKKVINTWMVWPTLAQIFWQSTGSTLETTGCPYTVFVLQIICAVTCQCCPPHASTTLQMRHVSLTTYLPNILYFSNDNDSRTRMHMRSINSRVCSNTKSSLCRSTTKSTLLTHKHVSDSKDEIKNYII